MRFGARLLAKQEVMRTRVRADRRMWRKRNRNAEIAAVYAAEIRPRGFAGFRNSYMQAIRRFWWAQ